MFEKFNRKHDEQITLEEFVGGIEYYTKCPEDEKVKNLFELYDLHNQNGIAKEDFLQMVFL